MPRIDPAQLLSTLAVLLSPKGGIKSNDEVVRLVQLMQKFSKKLVSKSIYIEILKATSHPLLERFLNEKGWDLLNIWFSDSVKNHNWPLCHSIISLFITCPVTADLLKDTVEVNQAPKLINQLRVNPSISDDIRILANAVYNKWVHILSPQKSEPNKQSVASNLPSSPLRNVRKARTQRTGAQTAKRIISNDFIEDSDDSSDKSSCEDIKPPVMLKIKVGKGAEKNVDPLTAKEENGNPISLLQSLANEVSEDLKNEKAIQKEEKAKKRRSIDEDRKEKERKEKEKERKEKEKEKEKERKEKEKKHKHHQNSELSEKERKKFRVDRRDEVDPDEKQRIREKARLLKEEAQAKKDKNTLNKLGKASSTSSSFSRIPKIPKKTSAADDEKKGIKDGKNLSFEELLGELDSKPKSVKVPQIKNKTVSLLESFSKTKSVSSEISPKHVNRSHHHSSSSSKREDHMKEKENSSSKNHSSSDISRKVHDEKHPSSKPLKLSVPKKPSSSDLESPKSKNSSFAESTSFMDAILNSMGGGHNLDGRKKKRHLSERDDDSPSAKKSHKSDERENKTEEKSDNQDSEDQQPSFSFYRDTLEEQTHEEQEVKMEDINSSLNDTNGSLKDEREAEDLPFEEPDELPREVKGILVLHRGVSKRNKKIQFKKESDLVDVRYFELDETERVNVNKIKFENMRQMELEMEKATLKSKDTLVTDENEVDHWTKPIKIDVTNREPFVPGHLSKERDIQFNREKTVLTAFFYSKETIPDTPSEPDALALMVNTTDKPVSIPLEDISADSENLMQDFAKDGWPDPKTNQVDRQADFENNFSLNPALNELLSSIGNSGINAFMPKPTNQQQLSQDEQRMLQAQTEAMAKLGMIPGVDVPSNFSLPHNQGPMGHPGFKTGKQVPMHCPEPIPGPHEQHMTEEDFDYPMEDPEYYNGPPQQGFGPPPPHQGFGPPQQHFERGRGNRGFRGGPPGGRFGPGHPVRPNDQPFCPPSQQFPPGINFGPQQFGPGNNFPPRGRGFHQQNNRGFRGGMFGPPVRGQNDFRRPPRGGIVSGGPQGMPRPCKFFNERGFCRDGDNCRFLH